MLCLENVRQKSAGTNANHIVRIPGTGFENRIDGAGGPGLDVILSVGDTPPTTGAGVSPHKLEKFLRGFAGILDG